jgi:hypothetical protein
MGRPVGVTIIAVLWFVGAVLCVVGGIGMMVGGGFMATLINQQGGQGAGAGAGVFAGLGAAVGVIFLVFAAIGFLLGWGLLKLKNWARLVTIILMAISIAFGLLGLVGTLTHFNLFAFVWSVCWLAIYALIIWYLLKPEVKAAFQAQARPVAA